MKLNYPKKHLRLLLVTGICAGVLFAQQAVAAGNPVKKMTSVVAGPGEEEPAKKKEKSKAKNFASLNNSSVKIYPDAVKREMHVVAKENDGKEIDFFVFDLQGTLVQNYKMKAKDHNRISGLARGTYMYRVFCGDEETAAGKFEIR
ncbi:MAG: T9SS type A sorting domain-containing protein [Sphingobacteriales bacterium]|nr:T9SS type A sorting domain-containing protein [Sphingobacteriales bacterium]